MHIRILNSFIYLSVGLLLFACQQEMKISPAQSATFIKLYGGFNIEKASAVEQTADGGYVCLGSTNSTGNGGQDIYIIKTDKGGNKEWEKTFGGTANDEGKALQVLPDGSFLCLGDYMAEDGSTDLYLIKLSPAGEIIWTKTIGQTVRNEKGFDLKSTATGDLLLIGISETGPGTTDMFLVKTDAASTILWQKEYGLTGLSDHISAVRETSEGNLVWCGSEFRQRTGSTSSDMRVVLTNPEGNIIWDRNFGKENTDKGSDILLNGSGYLVLGSTYNNSQDAESDIYLINLFQSGTVRWEQAVQKPKSSEEAKSIYATRDGGYIITGSTSIAGNSDILLLKVDNKGQEVWSKSFGGLLPDIGHQVRQTSDGGYIIFGTIYFETNPMLCLIKTSAEGELNTK